MYSDTRYNETGDKIKFFSKIDEILKEGAILEITEGRSEATAGGVLSTEVLDFDFFSDYSI